MKLSFNSTVRLLLFLFLSLLITVLLINPARYVSTCFDGISLWAINVLPATLPFLFLTSLLTSLGYVKRISSFLSPVTKKLFRLNEPSGYIFLMSLVSGYPIGIKILSELTLGKCISPDEASDMSCIASAAGPVFVLGSVGNAMYHSLSAGLILLISHYLSIITCGIITSGKNARRPRRRISFKNNADDVLYSGMLSSVLSVLCTGGFIAVFYLLSVIIYDLKVFAPFELLFKDIPALSDSVVPFLRGLIEMTGGAKGLSLSSSPLALPLTAFLITFGGLSVMLQQIALLKKSKITTKRFIFSKLIQSLLAFAYCFIFNMLRAI